MEKIRINKTSSASKVDAFQPGSTFDHEGQTVTVVAYGRKSTGCSYIHMMDVRPANAEEAKKAKIASLTRRMRSISADPFGPRYSERGEIQAEIARLKS